LLKSFFMEQREAQKADRTAGRIDSKNGNP